MADNFENAVTGFPPGSECSICKGRCCKEHGCSLSPDDLPEQEWTQDAVLALLKDENLDKGIYAIDRCGYEGGVLYFLRMRHKCFTFIGVDAMGECVMLTDEGCQLPASRRPKGGRFLESSPDFHCKQGYLLADMAADWAPYQEVLADIWQEYEKKWEADGTFAACDRAYFEWMKQKRYGTGQKK